jgi:hypothetical protein
VCHEALSIGALPPCFPHRAHVGRDTRHIGKASTVRLLKKTKIYFQNVLFLSDLPYLKLRFYIVCTIIKAFIRGLGWHSGLCTVLLVGRSWDQSPVMLLGIFSDATDGTMCTRKLLGVKTAGA